MDTKKLRQKILNLAIRGKLVSQDPNDEPASVLLERIRAEKERLIKEGKIKRSKKSASDTPHYENEVPYKVPQGWEWCRLSEIANYGGGKTPSMDNKQYWSNGTNLWITSKDMKSERITDSMMKISNEALDIMTQYEPGTLLMVTRSGILRHTLPIAILEKMATVNQDLKTISLYLKGIHEYVYYAIKAREHYILKEYHKDGTTVDSINFEKFAEIPLPIPPYNEQKRIVTAIKHWLSFIEELEKEANDLESSIQQTKSKILDLAIHGQLVPQDPNDEPATELLKRINPSFVPCDNAQYQYEIPESWTWCKLVDLCSFLSRGKSPTYSEERKYPVFAQKCNLYDGDISLEQARFLDPATLSKWPEEYKLRDGDILVNSTGTGTVGRTRLFHSDCLGDYPFVVPDSHVSVIRTVGNIVSKYVYSILSSRYGQDYFEDNLAGSTNQKELYIGVLESLQIPLPPNEEQMRIAAKIKELFAVLDEIQESIEA